MKALVTSIRVAVPVAIVAALVATIVGGSLVAAQTPEASPEASPIAIPNLPQGPLGEQIQWVVDLLNGDPADITVEEIEAHLTPAFLDAVPAEEIVDGFLQVGGSRPLTIEDDLFITTMDLPATNGRFVLVGGDGSRIDVSIQIERDTGLISGLLFEAASEATPEASPSA